MLKVNHRLHAWILMIFRWLDQWNMRWIQMNLTGKNDKSQFDKKKNYKFQNEQLLIIFRVNQLCQRHARRNDNFFFMQSIGVIDEKVWNK